ncbi:Zn finger-containing GTPase- Activating Protein for ARF [Coemansia sp. RSA 487]|nr:Zn finger-containing GTPase- Activating Protein for ARF [Coemansia sp. RSA 487]
MDKWTSEQLKRMQMGGNAKALAFFESQPDYNKGMSIKDKYNSRFAELWRQKLTADCEGRPWTAPPPSATPTSPLSRTNASSPASFSGSNPQLKGLGQALGGSSPVARGQTPDSLRQSSSYSGMGSSTFQQDSMSNTNGTNDFSNEGSNTPSGSFSPQDIVNDPSAALSKGWSLFSMGAQTALSTLGTVAGSISDNYVRPAAGKIHDPNFRSDVTNYVSTIGSKLEESANRGFTSLSNYVRSGQPRSQGAHSQVPPNSDNADTQDKDDDFFENELNSNASPTPPSTLFSPTASETRVTKRANTKNTLPLASSTGNISPRTNLKKSSGWDDEWDNF